MRQAFAHDALLAMGDGADEAAPGAAVTVALCGHWDHEQPCPLAPHHVRVDRHHDGLHVRILFVTEPEHEAEVRRRVERALAGRWQFPDGFTTPWRLLTSASSDVTPDEADHASRLAR